MGPNHIYINTINGFGEHKDQQKIVTKSRVLRFTDDDQYKQGTLLLMDKAVSSVDFMERQGCKLYSFPYSENKQSSDVTLSILKAGKVFDLLTSAEDKCVAFDSYFTVVRANKSVFEKEKEMFGVEDEDSDNDAVRQAFNEKDYVKCVVCTSDQNQRSRIYSIKKKRDEETEAIQDMLLIKDEANVQTIEGDRFEKPETDTAPVSSFYITSEEYGEHTDNYCQVSTNQVKVFDKKMDRRLTFSGLNIRNAIDIHQAYMYTINDMIVKPITIDTEDDGLGP